MRSFDQVFGTGALLVMITSTPGCAPQQRADEAEKPAAEAIQSAGKAEPPAASPTMPADSGEHKVRRDAVGPRAQRLANAGDVAFRDSPPRPGITPVEIIAELERIRTENSLLRPSEWTNDAGATVARDPKLASQMARLLLEPTSTFLMRSIGLSLLRTDGSEHGQAALREVLSDPGVQADSMYPILLLGLASMPRPAEETVALIKSLRSSTQVTVRESATTVLGGQIWALSVSGRVALADSLATVLTDALKASRDPAEQANLIAALAQGNRPQTRATVRGYANAKEPLLRAATAKGLASDEQPEAVNLLMKLLVDPAQEVQSVALDSLHWRTLSAAQQRTVHAAIMKGTLRPKDEVLLALFVERHLVAAPRKEALEALLTRNAEDVRVQEKVREVLARVSLN
jgi:HEAT repeat protein